MFKFWTFAVAFLISLPALAEVNSFDSDIIAIGAGSPTAVGNYVGDTDFTGGSTSSSSLPVNTSHVSSPAPQSVYQNNRYGNFFYAVPSLNAGGKYLVRLHFSESYWTAPGARTFNVSINGLLVLNNFDIFTAAGGRAIANVQEFVATADANGRINIQFATVTDNAQVNGIEIQLAGSLPTPTPTPTYNLSLTSDKAEYVAGNRATVVATLNGQPASAEEEFFVGANFASSPIALTNITKTQSYAITPALPTGNSLFTAQVFLQNSREAAAFIHAVRHYQEEIAGWQADLVVATDPNEIATLNSEITHDQTRLAATQAALTRARTPVGGPVNLILATH